MLEGDEDSQSVLPRSDSPEPTPNGSEDNAYVDNFLPAQNTLGEDDEDDTDKETLPDGSVTVSSVRWNNTQVSGSGYFRQLPISRLERRMGTIIQWERLVSCVAISSKVGFNAYQYNFYARSLK